VVGDARRGSGWWAELDGGIPNPQVIDLDQLPSVMKNPAYALEDLSKLELPETYPITLVIPTARLLIQAWQELEAALRGQLAQLPPQPAYLKPPHITKAKPGHPLLRDK